MPSPRRTRFPGYALLVTLSLLLPILLAPPAAATQVPEPSGGPTVSTPDKKEKPGGTITVPGREAESEHLFLAVIEEAVPLVDAQAIIGAVEAADIGSGERILLGVDREPSSMKSPEQLIRGMLLFGESDALSDDWVQNGKTRGYLGKGWIAIGVILPATEGGQVRVAVEAGRNITVDADGGTAAIAQAGAEAFARGDYTRGLSELAVAAGTSMHAPFNILPWLAGTGAALAVLAVVLLLRRRAAAAQTARRQQAAKLIAELEHTAERALKRAAALPPIPGDGILARRTGALLTGLEARVATDLALTRSTAPENAATVEKDDVAALALACGNLENIRGALNALEQLLGGGSSRLLLERQIAVHRGRLQEMATGLDTGNARALPEAKPLLSLVIEHTLALDALSGSAAQPGGPGPEPWDRLEELRQELEAALGDFVPAARRAGIKLPAELTELLLPLGWGAGERQPDEHDLLESLELATGYVAQTPSGVDA